MLPTNDDKAKVVILSAGEVLEVRGADHQGVHTDAGIHPWDECEAYRIWREADGKWLTVPLH